MEYNIVKYCKTCKTRFVVGRAESKRYYCDTCQAKMDKEAEKAAKKAAA